MTIRKTKSLSSHSNKMNLLLCINLFICFCTVLAASQGPCVPAEEEPSPLRHQYAVDNLQVSKVSFSSCHVPEYMDSVPNFWADMRRESSPDIWLWLGDNMYKDGEDINAKVSRYWGK